MTTFPNYQNSVSGYSCHIKELIEHPNWKSEERSVDLKHDSYALVKESDSERFRLIWLSREGEKVSIPFWTIETPTFQWCFRNGQANTFSRLDELIVDVFKHFKEKEI